MCSAEASLEAVSQTEAEEAAQPSDDANLPSTSQEPSSSSAGTNTIILDKPHVISYFCFTNYVSRFSLSDTSSSQPPKARSGSGRQWTGSRGSRSIVKRGETFVSYLLVS